MRRAFGLKIDVLKVDDGIVNRNDVTLVWYGLSLAAQSCMQVVEPKVLVPCKHLSEQHFHKENFMAGKQNDISYKTALELLKNGNDRYVADQTRRPNATRRRRLETGSGQWPFAIVLTCADSRVAPELIFDQGIGDIFVARVAGNVATSEVIASIQYAVEYIRTELIVVLGHESCGAVGAAIHPPKVAPKELGDLVKQIQDAIGREQDLDKAVEKNAKFQEKELRKALKGPALKHAKVCAATYGLRSGEVHWL